MSVVETIIAACGGAFVTGIFALIKARKDRKQKECDDAKQFKTQLQEIVKSINKLENALLNHITEEGAARADDARMRIILFGDEAKRGITHTEEHWKDILRDIDKYETYCTQHPEYLNSRAVNTIDFLQDRFQQHLQNNDFLI